MGEGTGDSISRPQLSGRGFVRGHPLAAFYVLSFILSWGYWLAVVAAGGHQSHFPGLLGPGLASIVVTALVAGSPGVADLWSRMTRWRVAPRWYLAALAPVFFGAVVLLLLVSFRWVPTSTDLTTMPGLPAMGTVAFLLAVLVVNGYGEEVGWRGFAWPHLTSEHDRFGAALRLAAVWALWHLPTFWLDTGMTLEPWVIPGWLVGLVAGAVVLGWLYDRARSSLFVAALFHTSLNIASATPATEGIVAGVVSGLVIVWAVVILRQDYRHRVPESDLRRPASPPQTPDDPAASPEFRRSAT